MGLYSAMETDSGVQKYVDAEIVCARVCSSTHYMSV